MPHTDFLEVFLLDEGQIGVALHRHVRSLLLRLLSGVRLMHLIVHLAGGHGSGHFLLCILPHLHERSILLLDEAVVRKVWVLSASAVLQRLDRCGEVDFTLEELLARDLVQLVGRIAIGRHVGASRVAKPGGVEALDVRSNFGAAIRCVLVLI